MMDLPSRSPNLKMRCWIATIFCFFHFIVVSPVSSTYLLEESTTTTPTSTRKQSTGEYPYDPENDVKALAIDSSTITLIWDLGPLSRHQPYSTTSFSVWYRLSVARYSPPMFFNCVVNETMHYCTARNRRQIEDSVVPSSEMESRKFFLNFTYKRKRFLKVTASRLKFPGTEYEFHFAENELIAPKNIEYRTSIMKASTLPEKPKAPPKTCSSCFYILSVEEKKRTVKVYWRPMPSTFYTLEVYEEGNPSPIFTNEGPADNGWMFTTINFNCHYFIFRTINALGVSKDYTFVRIPHQHEILSPIESTAVWDATAGTMTLSWKRPERRILSYTVFWVDFREGTGCQRINDYVHLPASSTSFAVIANGSYVGLGLSVNAEHTSTGIVVGKWV